MSRNHLSAHTVTQTTQVRVLNSSARLSSTQLHDTIQVSSNCAT